MKLLLDENLSRHLIGRLEDCFPDSAHVSSVGLLSASDDEIWQYARQHEFIIVSKDSDFHQRSFLYGPPPKVIWIALGNASTQQIEELLRSHTRNVRQFQDQTQTAFMVIGKK